MNRRFWTTWPFLCLLACLFVASVTAPRAWQKAAKNRPAEPEGPKRSTWNLTLSEPESTPPPSEQTDLAPVPGSSLLADSTRAWSSDPVLEEESSHQQETKRLMAFATASIEPATTASPVSTVTASTQQMTADEDSHDALADQPDSDVPVSPSSEPLVKPLPDISEEVVIEDTSDVGQAVAIETIWPQPQALLDRLAELAEDSQAEPWAREVKTELEKLGPAVAAHSDEALMIIGRLNELARQADHVAVALERTANPMLGKLRRTQHAMGRRLDIWRRVLLAGGPDYEIPAQLDSRRLGAAVAQIDAILGPSEAGKPWREFLKLDDLEQLASQPIGDQDAARRLARNVLRRLGQANLTAAQRQFLAQQPMVELASSLRDWLDGSVDLTALLRHIEAVEQTGLPSDGRSLADDCQRLAHSPVPVHRTLSERIQLHYRNANIRVAITEDLLNRLMPDREPQYQLVHDQVMGRPVHGQSRTSTDLAVKLIPDPRRLRLALEIKGMVSALTASTAGPATFYSDSESTYVARKEIELTTQGLKLWPAQVGVDNDLYLRGLKTSLDPIPLVGSLVKEVARSQHEQSRPAMSLEVERKVATRAKQQIDGEADARLGYVSQRLQSRFVEPFAAMSLGPAMISAETTDIRMTMRLRFAAEEQLAAWTPRPQAPADSLLSIQMHDSMLNNIIEQMDLDGGTFTVASLRQRIAQRFNRPEMLKVESSNDDVVIRFADKDAARVECRDGRLEITLSVDTLSRSPHRWNNFQVRAFYRPEMTGRTVELTREGVVRLVGKRISLSDQIALRGIFSKTFSKDRPWSLTPETILNNPKLAQLGVTQFVIEDGWVGLAFGPVRAGSQPVIARRADKETE